MTYSQYSTKYFSLNIQEKICNNHQGLKIIWRQQQRNNYCKRCWQDTFIYKNNFSNILLPFQE